MHNIGIYTIYCSLNNKYYVGYSKNLKKRIGQHKLRLKKNIHQNIFLQRAYNKYGKDAFEFDILENCEEQFLCSLEHYWCNMLNTHNKKYGYNILPTHPNKINSGHSLETILKMKNATKICEHRENRRKKIIIYSLNGEFIEIVNSILEAANKLNTNTGNIVHGLKSKSKCVSNHLIALYKKDTRMLIKPYIKSTGHQVFLKVLVDENVKYYKSFREAAKDIAISRSYITKYLDTNIPYKRSLTHKNILFFSLTKKEYQKITIKN
jgi:group I intron endonuclease